jgi:hypothetical protein
MAVDAPLSSLMDSTASLKVKTTKGKGVGHVPLFIAFRGKRVMLELHDGIRTNDKRVNYSCELAQTKQQVD